MFYILLVNLLSTYGKLLHFYKLLIKLTIFLEYQNYH